MQGYWICMMRFFKKWGRMGIYLITKIMIVFQRTLSARAANADYFGISQEGLEELKETQAIILNAIKRPRLVLESAAFVWMVKTENE